MEIGSPLIPDTSITRGQGIALPSQRREVAFETSVEMEGHCGVKRYAPCDFVLLDAPRRP